MYSLLLCIIYLSFISLGLPDSLLGSAWPVMGAQLEAPTYLAGIISMIITGGTIVSSLMSDWLSTKLGAGKITAISVLTSAFALLGFSAAGSAWWLCVLAIPYGLAAGAVDAALNHYVATHFAAKHMNWLHCFWGVGACVSPYIMSACLAQNSDWRMGYRSVSLIQFALALFILSTLFVWKRPINGESAEEKTQSPGMRKALKRRGVKLSISSFIAYMALETTTGLWISSYLVACRGTDEVTAARMASLFYIGITGGRLVGGFVADRLRDKTMVRIGIWAMFAGSLLIVLPVDGFLFSVAGLVITGIGGAPLYPSLIHATPDLFGKRYSQAVIGLEMGFAYVGSTLAPPLFGAFSPLWMLPLWMLILSIIMIFTTEGLWIVTKNRRDA